MLKLTNEQIQTAKNVPITDVMQWYGFAPLKKGAKWLTYPNPFRMEKTPSFMVCPQTNTFRDFGTAESGDVIELIRKFERCDFRQAVAKLTENQNFSFNCKTYLQKSAESANKETFYLQSLKPLQNTTLLKYIEQRRLNPKFAKMYLKEIYYKIDANQPKNYFGICLENERKGFEVKNIYSEKYYCLGKKDISAVILKDNSKEWLIFEGMFDFIALLTHLNRLINGNVLILHSVTNTEKALKHLENLKPEMLYLFLDNDIAGNETTEKFMQAFICKDFRKLYKAFKDLNEMILSRP